MAPALVRIALQPLGEAPANLVEDQADQRLGAGDVGGRDDQEERDRPFGVDEVGDAPVARRGGQAATVGSR